MKSAIYCMLFAVSPLLSTAISAQQTAPRPIAIDDSLKFREVHDPQLSPDAQWLAYTVSTPKLKDDSNKERIWMVPISASGNASGSAGAEPVALTSADESSTHPRWSPDGKYIAFLSGRHDEKTQIWLLNRLGGEAEKLTDTAQDVDEFYWSPDGQRLALILRDPSPEELEDAKDKDKDQDKVKKTSTLGQKVHNTFSKHKRYNGYKVKHKRYENGHMVKTKKKVQNDQH